MKKEELKKIDAMMLRAKTSLVDYRYILLTNSDGEVTPADYQRRWSDDLLHGTCNQAKQGFRESGKSQYVLRAFPLYCMTFPAKKRDYIVLIKKNSTLANNKLKEIEREYLSNPLISANLKKVNEQSGEIFDVDVSVGGKIINVRIESYGKGASIRGLSSRDRRPKIVIVDDPQDAEDAQSETVQESDWSWFLSDVKFLGVKTRIFLIGNNLGEKSIIERVFTNAVELGFETERISCLTDDGKSSWPAKYTVEGIEQERENFRRIGKIDIWMREKMCQAVSEENRCFSPSDFRYYVSHLVDKIAQTGNVFLTLDPASSPNPGSCLRAMIINSVNEDNFWHILDVPYGRWDSSELIDILFDKVRFWKPQKVGIEKGMFKQIIEPFIHKEMSKRNVFFEIVPIEHAKRGSKLERVKMLAPRFRAHTIYFPDVAPWLAELMTELTGVTREGFKSLYTDVVDALAMQEQIVSAPLNAGLEAHISANRQVPMETVLCGDRAQGQVPMETII